MKILNLRGVLKQIKNFILRRVLLPVPFQAANIQYSMIAPMHDEVSRASDRLLDVSLRATQNARDMVLDDVCSRTKEGPCWAEIWPGEHYKFLAGMVAAMEPKLVIEIGTFTGMGTLSLLKTLPINSTLVTFDLIPWRSFDNTLLLEKDFQDGRLEQRLGNLADQDFFQKNVELMKKADLIFIDGPKDVVFETTFFNNLDKIHFDSSPLLVIDDIKLWNMLKIWRNIKKPKLDITSFGHWSGTGLVDWC